LVKEKVLPVVLTPFGDCMAITGLVALVIREVGIFIS